MTPLRILTSERGRFASSDGVASKPGNGALILPAHSFVELRDLKIPAQIGTYGPQDVVPEAHLLDLTLTIASRLVMVARDEMALVFDYDPLMRQIDALARADHFETQERLMTRIVEACVGYPQIEALDIRLRKRPVLSGTGTLGVRLIIDAEAMGALRGGEA